MGRPVNSNVPEAGYKSKKQFDDTGSIAKSDFAVVADLDNSRSIKLDPSALSPGKTMTIVAPASGSDINITLPSASGTLVSSSGVVSSIAKSGSTALVGAVTLTGGTNVTLTQSGQDISIAASGGGGGTPGGSDTQVQFNDGGSFGGNDGLVYDKTNKKVSSKILAYQPASQALANGGTISSASTYLKLTPAVTTPPTATVTDITTSAATALAGKSFFLGYYISNTYQALDDYYYIWYKVSGSGSDPGLGGQGGIEVDVLSTDTATTVATATKAAITSAIGSYVSIATLSGAQFTVTNIALGSGGGAGGDNDTGFAIVVTQGDDTGYSNVTTSASTAITSGISEGQMLYLDVSKVNTFRYPNNVTVTILDAANTHLNNDKTITIHNSICKLVQLVYINSKWMLISPLISTDIFS